MPSFSRALPPMWRSSPVWRRRSVSAPVFTPRGGGTGTNGQALNQGIIIDMSRYMNRIIEINPEEGWVRVEAGVIKDQLNQF